MLEIVDLYEIFPIVILCLVCTFVVLNPFVVAFLGTKFWCSYAVVPLRTHASMCCFKIWYFFIPNIVCIKGEEYDELKGALGNKKRLKSWWITFNHTDDDDEMKAVRKKGVRGNIACIFLDRLYKWMSYLVHLRCYWHKNARKKIILCLNESSVMIWILSYLLLHHN